MEYRYSSIIFTILFSTSMVFGQNKGSIQLEKTTAHADRKSVMMNANNVAVTVYNHGSIAPGDGLIRHINNFVWNGLGNLYTAGLVIGAEVTDTSGNTIHILSDAINDGYARDFNPVNNSILYAWQPIPGYDNPEKTVIATNDDPTSWTSSRTARKGFRGEGSVLAKKEAYYVMDDSSNSEFAYFPFPNSERRGLGLQVEGRMFQFDDPNASNVLFAMYTIKNVSTNTLSKTAAGFYIDVDIGGGSPENQDDLGFFQKDLNLVYYWDNPPGIGELGLPTHYSGCVILESPSNSSDGIDNDGDGMTDESSSNNIDDDGDWDPAHHDVGLDGISGTADAGEGDGVPSAGEPNFDVLDREESDQIGLTSFTSWRWTEVLLRNDESAWSRLHFGLDGTVPAYSDVISLLGSGDFSLAPNEQTRYTVALFSAWNLEQTLMLAATLHDQYDTRFYSDSSGNKSVAVQLTSPVQSQSVDGTISITWQSSGILQNRMIDIWYSNTFEPEWKLLAGDLQDNGSYPWNTTLLPDGAFYKIRLTSKQSGNRGYSSTHSFFSVDNPGNAEPDLAFVTKFDKPRYTDTIRVQWAFADAEGSVVTTRLSFSADNGITFTPIDSMNTGEFLFDTRKVPNTQSGRLKIDATDGTSSRSIMTPTLKIVNYYRAIRDTFIVKVSGTGTGEIIPVVIDSTQLTGHVYSVTFDSSDGALLYSVIDKTLNLKKIDKESLSPILAGSSYFDGMRVTIKNDSLGIDSEQSGFMNNADPHIIAMVGPPSIGVVRYAPMDIEVQFTSIDTTEDGSFKYPGDTLYNISLQKKIVSPFYIRFIENTTPAMAIIRENTINNRWEWGEQLIVRTPPPYMIAASNTMAQVTFNRIFGISPSIAAGDKFLIRTTRPFSTLDSYEFTALQDYLGPTGVTDRSVLPKEFTLFQNYPNPFNPVTTIRFAVPRTTIVTLSVFDGLGREVKTIAKGMYDPGEHRIDWNGTDMDNLPVASGLYFYRISAGSFSQTKKMLLLK